MQTATVLAAVLIVVGTLGVLIPVLPGTLLCVAGVLLWSATTGGATAWSIFAGSVVLALVGWTCKYLLPGRRLSSAGVPRATMLVGTVCAVVGFFVIPYVGLALGFVIGVYVAEHARLRDAVAARRATAAAVRAVLMSVGIELSTATAIAVLWVCGLLLTR
ncbi:DUF456 domain-containing protein [Allobranchiibius huperziae]|uniref:DUF456 domain-containing protein n=2 Tax=Allobranchiibius TaxID=2040262 RepID=A0A853DBS2_9MICO|nr:DUF456 domain-containing protein [Allobranchiibius huperziae]NYJ75026.1 hypothetical protein [Allobranchiibius huperziae]